MTKAQTVRVDGPAPGDRTYVVGIAAVAAISGLLFGYDTAIINGALIFLREQFRLSDFQTEIAAGSLLVGCLAGASAAGSLSDRYGRKRLMLVASVLFCVSSLGTALPRTLLEFTFARFIAGTAIGVASVLAPLYIAEVSPAAIRGRLVTLNQMAIVTGILLSYFVSWLLSGLGPASWRWMFASAGIPSGILFVSLLFIPESPRWLVKQSRLPEAMVTLRRINGDLAAAREAASISESLSTETGSLGELLEPRLRRPLAIAILLAIFQQITGINTVIYYGAILFREHGGQGSASSAIGVNVTIGAMNFLCTMFAVTFIDRIGRKPLLLVGSAGMAISLGALAFAFRMTPVPVTLILTLVLCYVASFAIGLGPGVWVYISELFPTAVRGRAMSLATLCLWAACLAVTLSFLTLVQRLGAAGAFACYAVVCIVTFLFVWRFTPETKGRTLEQIQEFWRK
ncbi:MAG: sugar porter family MFS transporter [Bryobacteraceae bacterium]|jgi:sugar porter (SP) family MFS transporter